MTVQLHPSSKNIGRNYNFLLEQRNWIGFNTLTDAIINLKYKQPGTLVYITMEDAWYYWKNDIDGFVDLTTSGGASNIDTAYIFASRNSNVVVDQYLRTEDGIPMNLAPFLLPVNSVLSGISATCTSASNWQIEIHNNGVLIPGAILTMNGLLQNFAGYNITLSSGSKIQIYLKGTGSRPKVSLLIKKT